MLDSVFFGRDIFSSMNKLIERVTGLSKKNFIV